MTNSNSGGEMSSALCEVCAREKGEIGVRVECAVCHMIKKPRGRSVALESANAFCDSECPGYDAAPRVGDLWPGELRWAFGYGVPDDESDRCHRKPGGADADDAECYRIGYERMHTELAEVVRMTGVGPPSPPGRKRDAGAVWYDLLIRVNAFAARAHAPAPAAGVP